MNKPRKIKTSTGFAVFDRIKKVRLEAGLTQQKLASEAGVAVTTLRRVEQGDISISLEKLIKIMSFLGLRLTCEDEGAETVTIKEDELDQW